MSYWAKAAPQRYKDLGINIDRSPAELRKLPRFAQGKLYASRTGHGDFADYHERFGHKDARLECDCGRKKTPEHFFYCRLGWKSGRTTWKPYGLAEILGSPKGALKFAEWVNKTGYFCRICVSYAMERTTGPPI